MLAKLLHKIGFELQGPPHEYRRRPSSAGPERCIRSMVYHGLKVPAEPFAGRFAAILDDSSWHEELILDWIRKSAFQVHSEQMTVMTPVGPGNIDGIITDILSIDRLLEIKALNHFTFNRIWNGDYPLDYLTQSALYTRGLQEINPDIDELLLFIKNKNTAQYLEFQCHYDRKTDTLTALNAERSDGETYVPDLVIPNITNDAVAKFDMADDCIARNTLPERPFPFDTVFPCDYCRWGKVCWESYAEEFAKLETEHELSDEIADKVRYYKELGAQKGEITKEYDALRDEVKQTMKDAGVRSGYAGEYEIEIQLNTHKKIDQSLLPPGAIDKATITVERERMVIKKRKEK